MEENRFYRKLQFGSVLDQIVFKDIIAQSDESVLVSYKGSNKDPDTGEDTKGIMYVPYIPVTQTSPESPKSEYSVFMNEYNNNHKCCPKCGCEQSSQTYVGYILNMEDKESYKDKNRAICSNCGDVHIVHDRIPLKEII